MPISTNPKSSFKINKTRYAGLGYIHVAGIWRVIDIHESLLNSQGMPRCVGPKYKTRVELLQDIERYARESWGYTSPSGDIISIHCRSSCNCDDECDCPPHDELIFKINGHMGYGGGVLVYDDKTRTEKFACKFMGWEFMLDSSYDAVEWMKDKFKPFKNIVVDFF